MEAFLISTGIVALAEIGDKTQLLALVLAARFKQPTPIVAGILIATILNHFVAAAVGAWVTNVLGPQALHWVLGVSFILMAGWMMIPDTLDDADATRTRFGVFGTTLVTFFLAEIGDKTQVAIVALAAQYDALAVIVAGTTLGMMLANAPVVYFGDRVSNKIPVRLVHGIAAAIFAVLGVLAIVRAFGLAEH